MLETKRNLILDRVKGGPWPPCPPPRGGARVQSRKEGGTDRFSGFFGGRIGEILRKSSQIHQKQSDFGPERCKKGKKFPPAAGKPTKTFKTF